MIPPSRAVKHVAPGEGPVFHILGNVVTRKAAADDTGAFALFEIETAPGHGLPPCRQHLEDVAVFVLAGTYAARIAGKPLELVPGAYAFVPRGTVHAYWNGAAVPARMLILVSPGGIYERFLGEVGTPLADGSRPGLGKLLAAAPKYGIEFLPAAG